MKKIIQLITLFAIILGLSSCSKPTPAGETTPSVAIIEVTIFSTKPDSVDAAAFKTRDSQIERDYTSKQPGFIKRLSGVNESGEYVVVVYWKTMADADASMKKFMTDESVADYAGMIDSSSMKMARYKMLQ